MVTDLSQISVDFKVRDAFKFRKCKHSVECEDHLCMILQSKCSCFKDKRNDHTICFIRTTHKRHSKVDFIFLFLPFNAYTIFNLLHVDKCNNYILQSSDVSSRTKTNWESFYHTEFVQSLTVYPHHCLISCDVPLPAYMLSVPSIVNSLLIKLCKEDTDLKTNSDRYFDF